MGRTRAPLARRNFLTGLGLAGLSASGLSACGGGTAGSTGDSNTITFATAKLTSGVTMAQFTDAYNNSQSKYKVQVRELPPPSSSTEVHQQLVQSLSRKDGSIDVFSQDIIWIAEFGNAGWAEKLDGKLDDQEDYFPGVVDGCTFDGSLYAAPWYVDAGMLYYRTDLVQKPPTTWNELVTVAQGLQGREGMENGFLWQGKQAEVLVCNLVEYVASNGGGILGPDGTEVLIDQDEAIEAVQFMYDTINSSKISPSDVLSWDEEPSRRPFTAGQAPLMRQWAYLYGVAQDTTQSKIAGKVGVAPLPAFDGGTPAACLGGYQLGINASSTKKDAALDFVNWMSSVKTQVQFAKDFSNPATRSSVYSDATFMQNNPDFVALQSVFTGGTPRPVTPKYPQVSLALQSSVSQALSTGKVQESLTAAAKAIRDVVEG